MMIFECLRRAGLPAGVANLVIGPTSATYEPLVSSPLVKKISLTGVDPAGGRQMIRDSAATIKRLSMELGGNAPVIVWPDADIDKAAGSLGSHQICQQRPGVCDLRSFLCP
ncbi:Succinate-semialdehyde dehydrogenase [NADP(+)] GabD [Raoultella planticola]|uniref:Succinate-semialdehyde dehydrogenase [NADP(+)] GabD n=1 Tax=Raoultella planticola TaxID=575 RepID=A0A485ASZ4_RAOPL|nr:Succinate-semialdehyde dehydrogenase [NADP(+)] GabD [Raoultella planticola]